MEPNFLNTLYKNSNIFINFTALNIKRYIKTDKIGIYNSDEMKGNRIDKKNINDALE